MIKRNKSILLYSLCVVVTFLILNLSVSTLLVKNRFDNQHFGIGFVELRKPAYAKLFSYHDNLNILILNFKNPGLENKDNYNLTLSLEGNKLRNMDFTGYNLGDPGDLKFQFEPLIDSKNKTFQIEISSENYDSPVLFNADDDGALAYKSYYRTIKKSSVFIETLNYWKISFSNNITFFIFWLLALSIIIYLGKNNEKA